MSTSIPIRIPRILTIADSYSDGGAGIQVDLHTFTALSTVGMSVVTAVAARTTCDVKVIHAIPEDIISSQFRAVIDDSGVDALKIGMYYSPSLVECVVSLLTGIKIPTVVIDPVMVTPHLSTNSLTILRDQLLPVATLITPTLNESQILLGRDIVSLEDMKRAAQDLHRLGPKYVLIRDDRISSDALLQTQTNLSENTVVVDVLFDGLHFTLFKSSYVSATNAQDIRCTLTAAITAYLAHGLDMIHAIEHAIIYSRSVVQNSSVPDLDNDLLKSGLSLHLDQSSDDSLGQNDEYKPLVINEQEEQQKSQSESVDKVIIISDQWWIHEPQVLLQKRSFLQLLKNACLQEWFDYTHHPFVQGLANGTLPHASFKHYLMQDYIFLTHFARCYALAAYKSKNMSEILSAAENVCHIGRESQLHLSYCAEWGIDAASLASVVEARANLAYTRFTLDCGMSGDLLDLHVALSPCLLGYGEVGLRLFNDSTTKRDSPYWKWVLSYAASDYQKVCRECEQYLERLADKYGVWHAVARIKKLTDTFKTATKLEIGFWDMGLNVEW